MMTINKFLIKISFNERKYRQYLAYKKDYNHYAELSKTELDFEYINTVTKYEHKKNTLLFSMFMIVAVVLTTGLLFAKVLQNLIDMAISQTETEEVVKIGIMISTGLFIIVAATLIISFVLYLRNIAKLNRKKLLLKEVKKVNER